MLSLTDAPADNVQKMFVEQKPKKVPGRGMLRPVFVVMTVVSSLADDVVCGGLCFELGGGGDACTELIFFNFGFEERYLTAAIAIVGYESVLGEVSHARL